VNAIFAEEDVPKDQRHMTKLNAELAKLPTWKSITKRKAELPEAEEWKDKTDKLQYLIR
jgi:ferredoxin